MDRDPELVSLLCHRCLLPFVKRTIINGLLYFIGDVGNKHKGEQREMLNMASKSNFNQGVFFNVETTTEVWETPQDFFDKLNEMFGFTLDVCANHQNAKCKSYYTIEQDGLNQEWIGNVWMNPPYGRVINKWVQKAYESAKSGSANLVVCLVPARTCSEWWHEYCMKGEIWLIRHRLKFGGSKINAPFPNAVVIFKKNETGNNFKTIDRHGILK